MTYFEFMHVESHANRAQFAATNRLAVRFWESGDWKRWTTLSLRLPSHYPRQHRIRNGIGVSGRDRLISREQLIIERSVDQVLHHVHIHRQFAARAVPPQNFSAGGAKRHDPYLPKGRGYLFVLLGSCH